MYSLSLFSLAKGLQQILEISATYRLVSYLLADKWLICRLCVQCLISNNNNNSGSLQRCVTLFVNFLKKYKTCLCFHRNPNLTVQFHSLRPLFRHWHCFLSSVAMDGKDGYGLKHEKVSPTFSSFNAFSCKIAIMLCAPWKKLFDIFFITLQEDFVYGLKVLSNNFSRESVL